MAGPEQFSDRMKSFPGEQSDDFIVDLMTLERSQNLDLLGHIITDLKKSLIVCGPKGIGKTKLLDAFQEQYAKVWPIVSISATEYLSFEQIQAQLLRRLTRSGSGKSPQSLNSLLRGLEQFDRRVVLVCDDAGLLFPGLINTLLQYASAFSCLRIIFALRDDEIELKQRTDPSVDECYFIEIPACSESHSEFWQGLPDQKDLEDGPRDSIGGEESYHSGIGKGPLHQRSNDTFGKPSESSLDCPKKIGINGFNWFYLLPIAGVIIGASVLFLNHNAPISAKSSAVSTSIFAFQPLAIPGQTIPEPVPESPVKALAPVVSIHKPLLLESNSAADFYKGHGRSLEGDALSEFEFNNRPTTAQSLDHSQLKVEIIPSEPITSEQSVIAMEAIAAKAEMTNEEHSGSVFNVATQTKSTLSKKPETITELVKDNSDAIIEKAKKAVIKKQLADKQPVEKTKPPKPLQVLTVDSKKQAAPLIKPDLVKKPKLNTLESNKSNLNNSIVNQAGFIKPAPTGTSRANTGGSETVALNEQSKKAEALSVKPVALADTQSNAKVIAKQNSGEKESAKPSASRYALQLMAFTQQSSLTAFMQKHSAMGANLRTVKIKNKDGSEKYLVVYGDYESSVQANAAKRKLPAEFSQAWPRKL